MDVECIGKAHAKPLDLLVGDAIHVPGQGLDEWLLSQYWQRLSAETYDAIISCSARLSARR